MADVVSFPLKGEEPKASKEDGPHLEGPAFCGACQHEWRAVAPVGTTTLECPHCSRMWGAYKAQIEPGVALQLRRATVLAHPDRCDVPALRPALQRMG